MTVTQPETAKQGCRKGWTDWAVVATGSGPNLGAAGARCDGVLVEVSPGDGSCEYGDACRARLLLPDYEEYRAAHQRIVSEWLATDGLDE